ncbi:hypothetical protein [Kitasatospora sp. NPDC050463]|uniref:hypothetical protein n=1 Tax=Kitasatospora sp. NPDC050463 TaxID=3155786 RepID=UPI0033DCE0B2
MGCACDKGREQWEVVANDGDGAVLFKTSSKPTADTVATRYPGSIVRPEEGTAKTTQ